MKYDLEDRTYQFARRVRSFVKKLPRTVCNIEDVGEVVRSSGSVGANYIEANEALSKKDFGMRIRISRKESKETTYWLRLLDTRDAAALNAERDKLVDGEHRTHTHFRCHPTKVAVIGLGPLSFVFGA